ncbi:hypothetical protein EV424DRAFT_283945 [Suillus variegatus]|nr:hypothetical protein EV424DRAFT_283945 [Suillus variegatus]
MRHITTPLRHHINAPSFACPLSGVVSSYMGQTERGTQSISQPLSWTRNIVSCMMRRQDKSDIEMRAPHLVEVPYTAGKPRSYHARRKKSSTSSYRPPNTHPTQQPNVATQSTSPLSQQPPPAATASTFSADTSTPGTMEAPLRPHVTVTGWCARLVGWFCCVLIHINGEP